jgi:PAS domain S-box-containing protein
MTSLDDVLITAELARRPARSPDYGAENRALTDLAEAMAESPQTILQKLVETALDLCRADSAGISILEPGGAAEVFRWHATAGQFASNIVGEMPREASPCRVVLDRDASLLFSYPERHFNYGMAIDPPIVEALLVPFHTEGKPVGTLWVIAHTPSRQFDAEDERVLTSLSRLAAVAYQMKTALVVTDAGLKAKTDEVRQILDTTAIGLTRCSRDLRYLACNPAYEKLAGLSAEQIIGRPIIDVMGTKAFDVIRPYIERVLRGERVEYEEEVPFSAGGLRFLHVVYEPWFDSEGEVTGWIASVSEVTELRRTTKALEERERRLRLALDASGAGSWRRDTRTGRVDWDDRFRELYGLTHGEPASFETWLSRVHEEDRQHVLELTDHLLEIKTQDTFDSTFRIVRPDGTVLWIQSLGRAHRDAEGQVMQFTGIELDVTERWLAEEALRENEQREAFLLRLADTLRPLSDPLTIQEVTVRLLGEHLHVNRVIYADIEGTDYIIRLSHVSGVAPLVGRGPVAAFGEWLLESYRSGEPIVVNDVGTDPRFSEGERAHFLAAEIAAFANVMLVKDEKWVAFFGVNNATPRDWTKTEVELIRDVGERMWEAVERARAEEALREREQRLSLALDASAAGIWTWDRCTNQSRWDDRFHAQYGLGPEHPRTFDTWISRVHEEDRPRVLGRLDDMLRGHFDEWNAIFRAVRPDGTVLWMHNLGRADRRPDGEVTRISGINLDITEQRRAEEALRSSQTRLREFLVSALRRTDSELRTILKAAPIGIVTMDREGKITTWNDAAERIFGYTAYEVIGRINPAIPDDALDGFLESVSRVLEGATIQSEGQQIRKDRSLIYISLVRAPHYDEHGAVKGVITLVEDITGKRKTETDLARVRSALAEVQVEEARRISRELHDDIGQRLAIVSFEIDGMAARPSVSHDELVANLRSYQQKIVEIGDGLREISHRMHPSVLEHLGLSKALEHLCKDFSKREGIPARFHSDELANKVPHSIAACFYRVAQEALRNVSKHARAFDVEVKLAEAGQELQLSITDSGTGFDTTRATSGLGLHSMRERVELANGSFSVTSEPGSGTRILVIVPLHESSRPPTLTPGDEVVQLEEHVKPQTKKCRLLIGDDHPLVASGVAKLLEETYDVVGVVGDGLALVRAAEQLKPDLVLVDISMPVMNGFDAARQIRKSVPAAKLLFLTTFSTADYVDEAFKSGADGYLVKGAALSELPAAIAAVLEGHQYRSPQISKQLRGTA